MFLPDKPRGDEDRVLFVSGASLEITASMSPRILYITRRYLLNSHSTALSRRSEYLTFLGLTTGRIPPTKVLTDEALLEVGRVSESETNNTGLTLYVWRVWRPVKAYLAHHLQIQVRSDVKFYGPRILGVPRSDYSDCS